MKFKETGQRSVIKSVTFRILIVFSDLAIIYGLTKRATTTIALTVLTNVASTAFYFLHERLWDHVAWGRKSVKTGV